MFQHYSLLNAEAGPSTQLLLKSCPIRTPLSPHENNFDHTAVDHSLKNRFIVTCCVWLIWPTQRDKQMYPAKLIYFLEK